LLMPPARRAQTGAPGLAATRWRAVDVSAIARGTQSEGLGARSARVHPKRRLHEAAAPSGSPRLAAAISGRMTVTGSACRSVESVTRASSGRRASGCRSAHRPGRHFESRWRSQSR
jgi:hypothetical protein